MSPSTKRWVVAGGLALLLLALTLVAGLSSVSESSFRTESSLVGAVLGGPIRLLLPVAAALMCAPTITAELNNRFIVSTRTRATVRRHMLAIALGLIARCFLVFFVFAVIIAAVSYWFAPVWFPHAIDPSLYNLTSQEALSDEAQHAPIVNVLVSAGPGAYVLAVGMWVAVHAVAFGLASIVAAVLIVRAFIAWLVPLGIFLIESTALQVLNIPAGSYLISAVYPSGLSNYPIGDAVIALLVLLLGSALAFAVLLARAPRAERFM